MQSPLLTARRLFAPLLAIVVATSPAHAQAGTSPAPTQATATIPLAGPPIRKIETAVAVSTEPLGAITNVRQLSDGRILLNDGTRRRLLLLDSTLKTVGIVLDSLTEVQNAYGTRAGALIPYLGDSTLFVDPATFAMLVLDPAGRIARVRSVPRAQDINWITNTTGQFGLPGFDAKGRLVHRIPAQPARPTAPVPSNVPYLPPQPDSAFVVAVHLDSRKVDTLGAVRIVKQTFVVKVQPEGGWNINSTSSPLPLLDDWAVLPDGTVAFVRGRDYRVEYLNADGTLTSSEKLPFAWLRMTEEDKTRMMDSIKLVQTKREATSFALQMIAWSNSLNKPYPKNFIPTEGLVLPTGLPRDWILPTGVRFPPNYVYACPPGTVPPSPGGPLLVPGSAPAAPVAAPGTPACAQNPYDGWYGSGYTPPAPTYRTPAIFTASELPDYRPPIPGGAVRADADGNLWIRTIPAKPVPGGLVYDVVSRKGELVDRLQLPPGYSLAGFGAGRVVYLTMRDAAGLHLARVRLK